MYLKELHKPDQSSKQGWPGVRAADCLEVALADVERVSESERLVSNLHVCIVSW
jgi:hypothetical protein